MESKGWKLARVDYIDSILVELFCARQIKGNKIYTIQ